MADKKGKIALAALLLVTSVGGALLFRRPAAAPEVGERLDSELVLRQMETSLEPAPLPPEPVITPHLLGSIELGDNLPPPVPTTYPTTGQQWSSGELPEPDSAKTTKPPSTFVSRPQPKSDMGYLFPPTSSDPGGDRPANSFPTPRVHRVQSGETLTLLARRYLGSGERYRELYAANRGVLASPDRLPVGVELVIPADSPASGSQGILPSDPPTMVPIPPGAWRRSTQADPFSARPTASTDEPVADVAKRLSEGRDQLHDLYKANQSQLPSADAVRDGLKRLVP